MAVTRSVQNCRWGTPTLLLPWPAWQDAWEYEWSCTRPAVPRILTDPAVCRTCAHWAPGEGRLSNVPPVDAEGRCRFEHGLLKTAREAGQPDDWSL